MIFVSCQYTDCIHCDMRDYHCTKDYITIGEEFENGCNDFEPYYNSAEYYEKYYKCVETKTGELGKCIFSGKRIEYNGMVFFTSERVTEYKECCLTEARTGYGVGMYRDLENRFQKICELAEKYPNVDTLPLAEWDYGGYVLVKEGGNNAEE